MLLRHVKGSLLYGFVFDLNFVRFVQEEVLFCLKNAESQQNLVYKKKLVSSHKIDQGT